MTDIDFDAFWKINERILKAIAEDFQTGYVLYLENKPLYDSLPDSNLVHQDQGYVKERVLYALMDSAGFSAFGATPSEGRDHSKTERLDFLMESLVTGREKVLEVMADKESSVE
jgi:hypothetical protein